MPDPQNPFHQAPDPGSQIYPAAAYQQPGNTGAPAPYASDVPGRDPAVDMIRHKIDALYAEEPDAKQEIAELAVLPQPVSKHQQVMQDLHDSGASLVDIQTAWHNYYVSLPDHEKYEVWQEFYVNNGAASAYQPFAAPVAQAAPTAQPMPAPISDGQEIAQQFEQRLPQAVAQPQVPPSIPRKPRRATKRTRKQTVAAVDQAVNEAVEKAAARVKNAVSTESVGDIKKRILQTVGSTSGGGKLKAKHHLQSLAFGLASGLIVVFIFLFSFFNEFMIAPFIQPSRHANDTPVIVDPASTIISGGPKVIIPKINVEIPTDYSQTTTDEKQIELALDKGVVHYPTTVQPGQAGNAAYFGHSSNNIFNPGKYKFAFVLLHELVEGDTFYLTNNGTTYAYKVFNKRVVEPSEVGVLGPIAGHTATATLITCDPPGTSLHRLIVVGDQISPDPSGNSQPATQPVLTASAKTGLPGNGPTLWSRIWGSIF